MANRLRSLVRQSSGGGSSPLGSIQGHDSLVSKVLNDRLFVLLDAISDHQLDHTTATSGNASPIGGATTKGQDRGNDRPMGTDRPAIDKSTALEEMLKMALTDPDLGEMVLESPVSALGMSPKRLAHSPIRGAHSPLGARKRRDKHYVPKDQMAERVTSQLLTLTTKEVVPIQLQCIKILWALSTDAPAAREIGRKGGLRYLVRLLQEGGAPTNHHRMLALDALQNFATSDGPQLIAAGAIDVLMHVARFGDRHVQIKAALCLRNLLLKDATDIIPFGTLVELQTVLGGQSSPAPPQQTKTSDTNWPGFLALLQSSGIIFEVPNARGDTGDSTDVEGKHTIQSWMDMRGDVITDDTTENDESTYTEQSPPRDRVVAENESWHRLRPQKDGVGVNALWRVEDLCDENSVRDEPGGVAFTPSVLFVANRFGFDQGSEPLLLRLVKDAVATGWDVKVFAISLRRVPELENLPSVHVSSDPTVFGVNCDIMCIHMCDMQTTGVEHPPLRFFVCPTNSTAGISGLRKPTRMGLGVSHDASIIHLGVQRRSKSGIATMHNGPPPLLQPPGVKVDLLPMPSASNLLDHLRGELDGSVKVDVMVEGIRDYPVTACKQLVLTAALRGEEIFRSEIHPLDDSCSHEWAESFSCTSKLEGDSDTLTLTVLGLQQRASTAGDGKRAATPTPRPDTGTCSESGYKEIRLASASCSINALRTNKPGKILSLKLMHAGEAFGKRRHGTLSLRTQCRWVFHTNFQKPKSNHHHAEDSVDRHHQTGIAGILSQHHHTHTSAGQKADIWRKSSRKKDRDMRADQISDGKYYVNELQQVSQTVVRDRDEHKEATEKKRLQRARVWQAAQLKQLSFR